MVGYHHAVEDGHVLEDQGLPEGAHEPLGRYLVGLEARDVLALEPDDAAVGAKDRVDDVDLLVSGGPGRGHQAEQLALVDLEVDAAEDQQVASVLADALDAEEGSLPAVGLGHPTSLWLLPACPASAR